jgi:hypothetical protein
VASPAPGAEKRTRGMRAATVAFWTGPSVLALVVYFAGLQAWFFQDDFVWLGLRDRIYDFNSFWVEVFRPTDHGTFRPLSERLFFVVFSSLFGLDALPFRICVFLTFFATLILLSSVMLRVTGSRLAAFLAPVIWTANACMTTVMTWNSAYMQILCAFFILLAFYLFLRHLETQNWRYYGAQIAVFVVGFGVMETNFVYAGIAAAYTWLFARRYFRRTLPLLAISAVFLLLHMTLAPKQVQGPYSVRFDGQIFATFWTYWSWALLPLEATGVFGLTTGEVMWGVAVLTAALGAFLVTQLARKKFTGPFLFAVFAALIVPVLPLGGRVQYYYLTLPMMGLAALGAYAFARGWASQLPLRVISVVLLAGYLVFSVPVAYTITQERAMLTQRIESTVRAVVAAHRRSPDTTILLTGVDSNFFWQALFDRPFNAAGVTQVFLMPSERAGIRLRYEGDDITSYFLPASPRKEDIAAGRVIVMDVSRGMADVTESWARSAELAGPAAIAKRVDAANPLQRAQLGRGWYSLEQGYRWMAKRGIVTLRGPERAGERLHLSTYCQASQVADGPLMLTAFADGAALSAVPVKSCETDVHASFELPPALIGKASVDFAIEVDKTAQAPGDGRELGLVFGVIEIR